MKIAATALNRVPGAAVTAYTAKGVVYVTVPGALVPGPFAMPRKRTVLRSGTAVRIPQNHTALWYTLALGVKCGPSEAAMCMGLGRPARLLK